MFALSWPRGAMYLTHAHGMYNAAIKYKIIVLAHISQEINDLEWNEYTDMNERYFVE